MKKVLILLICLFAFPLTSYAANKCTNDYYNEISAKARNVNIVYQLEGINKNVASFRITITNLNNDMVVRDSQTGQVYSSKNYSNGILVIKGAKSGAHVFSIYSKVCAAKTSTLTTKSVSLPKYNPYYTDKNCTGLEQYSLCQKWSGYSKNKTEFNKEIKEIKEQKEIAEEENKKDNTTKEKFNLYKLLIKYWYILLLALIVAVCVYYLIAANRKKKEFDFKV